MKFEIKGVELLEAVQKLGFLSISGNNVLLIQARNNSLMLTYRNNLNILRILTSAEVVEPGSMAVRIDKFLSYLRTFKKSDNLLFNVYSSKDNNTCIFESVVKLDRGISNRTFRCESVSGESFPVPNISLENVICEICPEQFVPVAKSLIKAVNPDELQVELRGVRCSFNKDKFIAVATNGMILMEAGVSMESEPGKVFDVILNKELFFAFLNIFKGTSCKIVSNGNFITFYNDTVVLSGLVLEGTFPDYESYFDKVDLTFLVNKRDFLDNLLNVLVTASKEDFYRVRIKLIPNKCISISSGRAVSKYEVDGFNIDTECEVHVDGYFLKTLLDAMVEDNISIGISLGKNSRASYITVFSNEQRMLVVALRQL